MIGPADDELIHRALDGALSPEEAEQFRARVAADPALGARAERLERLAAAVDGLGPEKPPTGFSDRVMAEVSAVSPPRPAWHRRAASLAGTLGHQLFPWFAHSSEQGNGSSESFRRAGIAGGGVIVAKKVLWGVAGLAVVVILAVVYFNGRTVDQGAQGAIGAADRYRGAQPGSVDAKTGNAQAFLQSDTFDKMMKSKEVRSLLANGDVCALLADDAVQAALRDSDVQAAMMDDSVEAALKNAKLQSALQDETMQSALRSDTIRTALQDATLDAALRGPKLQAALADESVQAALSAKGTRAFLANADAVEAALKGGQAALKGKWASLASDADVAAALKNPKLQAMLADPSFEAALRGSNGRLANLLADDSFAAALKGNRGFAQLLGDTEIQAAMKNPHLQALLADDTFAAALKGDAAEAALKGQAALKGMAGVKGFAALLGDADFQAALRNEGFAAALKDSNFAAALKNQSALQAALREK
jgi:sulfur transfer complex TusBCD TusB component (DsrH family)